MKGISLSKKIYFVGIGGVSMSGLAQHLRNLGHCICGSDRLQNEYTARLQNLGVDVQSEDASVQGFQLVVKTSAVKDDHRQIVEAKRLGITVLLREEVLGRIFDEFATRIAVCGTHGKTTATSLLHHVLERCNVSHTAFIGGNYDGNNYFDGENTVIAEACEYKGSFLHLHPTHTLCLNVEYDHPDCYDSLNDVEQTFCKLFSQSQNVILPSGLSKLCSNGVFFDDFVAKNIYATAKNTIFDLYYKGQFVNRCNLPLVGAHNLTNAISVVSLCHQLNLPLLQVCHALTSFCGTERRWTEYPYKCKLICDYAHHPTEISATVRTAKSITKGRVICIFQPHTFTRTKAFFEQFAKCFEGATVIYLPIYPARELPIEGVTSQNLYLKAKSLGIDAYFCQSFGEATSFVKTHVTEKDTLLVLGAGDVVKMAKMLTMGSQQYDSLV